VQAGHLWCKPEVQAIGNIYVTNIFVERVKTINSKTVQTSLDNIRNKNE